MAFAVRHDYYAPMRELTKKQFSPGYPLRSGKPGLCRMLVFLGVLLLPGACSSLPDTPVTEESQNSWIRLQTELAELNSWEIRARAAIFANDEVYHVGINWQRQQNRFTLVLEAPFGQGVFRVGSYSTNGSSTAVMLTLPDGQKYFDESAEALLLEVLGWSIPVSGLEWWIKGLPRKDSDYSYELRGDGRLESLQQDEWKINYLEYFGSQSQAQGLPRKMYLKHHDLALKIVIERWYQYDSGVDAPVLFPEFN